MSEGIVHERGGEDDTDAREQKHGAKARPEVLVRKKNGGGTRLGNRQESSRKGWQRSLTEEKKHYNLEERGTYPMKSVRAVRSAGALSL